MYLSASLYEDILHHLYEGVSTIEHLLLSLFVTLQSEFLQPYLLVSLRSGILQSSLLASLQSKFILTSPLVSLWEIFLRRLYKDTPTVTHIYPNMKYFYKIFGDSWVHLNKQNLKNSNYGYLRIHHYNHIWSCSTSLLHIICLIISIILTPGISENKLKDISSP